VNRLSQETGLALVVTNDSHYLRRDDARAHEILLCIQTGKMMNDPNRMRWNTPDFYLKTRDEMMELFGELEDAVDRTWEIAQRCNVTLEQIKEPFPKFDVPEQHTTTLISNMSPGRGSRSAGRDSKRCAPRAY